MLTVECPCCSREVELEKELVDLRCMQCGAAARIAPDEDAALRIAA